MDLLRKAEQAYLSKIDVDYAYQFAKSLEQFRTNPVLGYRTAGSEAEFLTGERLFAEMNTIGLQNVIKDAFQLDTWEFSHARMSFKDASGYHQFELGGYQTHFVTNGPQEFPILYAGRGTTEDLDGLDLNGKLVLIDINQRDDWWISYPVYQAHLRGAAAVIAVQNNGYGEIDSTALNAQNIAGPADAPAFSLSQADAKKLKRYIASQGERACVTFDASSKVGLDGVSYNISGQIPGEDPDSMILVSAHYDSYFSGFQDDNAAVALMLGIAKALVESGYRPRRTLVFCAMAAEEWGVSNSKYDWSTGAYNQVFRVHPDWVGKVIADINFELPAYAHDTKDVIRCVYEYKTFLSAFADRLPDVTLIYPDGVQVISPVLTWSDDFSMAIAGIPSLVNDFAGGSFMETHYHSQFDNEDAYEEHIYRFHHALYGTMLLSFDFCAVAPLDFSPRIRALLERLSPDGETEAIPVLRREAEQTLVLANRCYDIVHRSNRRYIDALDSGNQLLADRIYTAAKPLNALLLELYKRCEDDFVRLSWHDDVIFPHEYPQQNLSHLSDALLSLSLSDANGALDALSRIDTNWYARFFDLSVCRYFTDYVLHQPSERLMWGAGRLPGCVDLFSTVKSLLEKAGDHRAAFTAEKAAVKAAVCQMDSLLSKLIHEETQALFRLASELTNLLKTRDSA